VLKQHLLLLAALIAVVAGCSGSKPSPSGMVVPKQSTEIMVDPSSSSTPSTTSAYWPTEGWRTSTPQEQNMDAEKLAQMISFVGEQNIGLHSLLIVQHGYIVSETYFQYNSETTKHELYSCTKSFTSALVGIAIDKGYISGVDQPVLSFFPEQTFDDTDELKQSMTLEDLLTMSSGLDWNEGDQTYTAMYQSSDWVKFVLDKPMAVQPGSRFLYNSGVSHVLSAIVQQKTGMNTLEFAQKNLFDPLGIDAVWEKDSQGIPIGGWGLQLTPRDMAKLGYLYLHNGNWDGQQIVSTDWVKASIQKHTGTDGDLGYGYQWWIDSSTSAFTALGLFGQTIYVIPDLDLVIVTTAQIKEHQPIFDLIKQYIIPACQ
jgi:CubicO group peptidase (beta-lactamase class C family)